jgi:hypothetical protein
MTVLSGALAVFTALVVASCSEAPPPDDITVPPSAVPRLTALASQFAQANGDARPKWADVMVELHLRDQLSAAPGGIVPNSHFVFMVIMRGQFIDHVASPSTGAETRTGKYLSLVVDSRTFRVLEWGLTDQVPPASDTIIGQTTYITIHAHR